MQDAAATVRELLARSSLPRNEVRILLSHVLQVGRTWLIAHDDEPLPALAVQGFLQLARRREAGEPIAYLLGHKEFMGHRFAVNSAVLIPRPETELLVETGLAHIQGRSNPQVLDLGTGSGAIAISMALARPDAIVTATDVSHDALEVARANALNLNAKVNFLQGNWWQALEGQGTRFDLIVSNPPYIAAHDAHLSQGDLRFEPVNALTEHGDGLSAARIIIYGARSRMAAGGALWLEHGYDQADSMQKLLRQAGFGQVRSCCDLAGIHRVTGGLL